MTDLNVGPLQSGSPLQTSDEMAQRYAAYAAAAVTTAKRIGQGIEDDRLRAQQVVQQPQPPDEFRHLRAAWDREQRSLEAVGLASFELAQKSDPDKRAEAQRVAADLGLGDADLAESQLDVFREVQRRRQVERLKLETNFPVLARHMRDIEFARIAHDSVEGLTFAEKLGQNWDAGKLTVERGQLYESLRRGSANTDQLVRLAQVNYQLENLAQPDDVFTHTWRLGGQMSQTLPLTVASGLFVGTAFAGAAAVTGPGIGPAFLTGTTIGMAAAGGAMAYQVEAGNAFGDMLRAGIDPARASRAAVGVGLVNGTLEAVGWGFATAPIRQALRIALAKDVSAALVRPTVMQAAGQFALRWAGAEAGETATEITQQLSTIVGEWAAAQGQSTVISRGEVWEQLVETAAATVQGMALLALPGPYFRLRQDMKGVRRAEEAQKFVRELTRNTKDNPLRKRSVDAMRQFLGGALDGTAADTMYFEGKEVAKVLAQLDKAGVEAGRLEKSALDVLRQDLPEVAAQIDEAIRTPGGDVKIPTADFDARISGTPLGDALMPHLRLDPKGNSMAEVPAIKAEQARLRKAADERMAANKVFQDEARAVEDEVLQQRRDAATGPITDEMAKADALYYRKLVEVQSMVAGMSPKEWHEKFGLKAVEKVEEIGDGDLSQFDEQGQQRTETPQFQRFFGNSKATHGGRPLVLYRGRRRGASDVLRGDVSYFTPTKEFAEEYSNQGDGGDSEVLAAYLSLQHPAGERDIRRIAEAEGLSLTDEEMPAAYLEQSPKLVEALKAAGFDGAIGGDNRWDGLGPMTSYVIFDKRQAKSVDNRGTFDPNEASILRQEASTRVPTSKKGTGTEHLDEVLTTDLGQFPKDTATYKNDVALMRTMPFLKIVEGATDDEVVEAFLDHVVGNLTWLHNQMTPEHRERSRQWYDGARKIVEQWSKRYGLTNAQVAAVIAVLSPQKDWFVNMTMAERLLDTFVALNGQKLDDKMRVRAGRKPLFGSLIPPPNRFQVRKQDGSVDKSAGAKRRSVENALAAMDGKTLGEIAKVDAELSAYWMRVYDQTYNDAKLARLTPEGGVFGTAAQRVQWTSYSTLAKVISVINDGSRSNISNQLGGAHKVRNFYNNIVGPNSKRWHVTIDTHAVGAAYLLAVSSKSPYVSQAWGGAGAGKNALYGIQGLYPFLAEAYRRAGAQKGINLLPREMQSITWEQVRAMFTAAEKRSGVKAQKKIAALRKQMDEGEITEEAGNDAIEALLLTDLPVQAERIWARYKAGELTADEAREQVLAKFGGFDNLFWEDAPPSTLMAATYEGQSRDLMAAMPPQPAPAERVAVTLAVEAQPDLDPALMAKWEKLSPEQKTVATMEILTEAVRRVAADLGTYAEVVEQRGAWEGTPAPSIAVLLEDSTYAVPFADALGKMLAQKAVYVLSRFGAPGLSPGSAVVIRMPDGYTAEQVDAFYKDVLWSIEIDGQRPAMGHSARNGFSTVAIKDPLVAQQFADRVEQVVAAMDGDFVVQINELYTAERTNKEHYGRQEDAAGDTPAGRPPADAVRGDADLFERGFARAEGRDPAAAAAAGPAEGLTLRQDGAAKKPSRGGYSPSKRTMFLTQKQDASTFMHELAHHYLHVLAQMATQKLSPGAVDDFAILLKWFGVESVEAWNALTDAQRERHHEAFAYSFELYLVDGKAPSEEMRGLFDKFAAWVRRTYTAIRDELNEIYKTNFGTDLPAMTADVRSVFDRMVASEEEIEFAIDARDLAPMFLERSQFPGTDAEWDRHQEAYQAQKDAMIGKLTEASLGDMEWLEGAKMRAIQKLQKRGAALRALMKEDVIAQAEQEPVYRALRYLLKGEQVEADGTVTKLEGVHRLDRDMVERMLGLRLDDDEQVDPVDTRLGTIAPETEADVAARAEIDAERMAMASANWGRKPETIMERLRGLVRRGGIEPDVAAEVFGFRNGEQLLRAILDTDSFEDHVEAVTDQRMMDEFGEVSDPKKMATAVSKALHGEARTRFVATELGNLAKATQPVRLMIAAAREAARAILAGRTVRSIRPHEFEAAETRARRNANKALRDGDNAAAINAKRDELVQHELAKLALEVQEEVDETLAEWKKLDAPDKKLAGKRNIDVVAAARAIVGNVGVGNAAGDPMAAMADVKEYRPDLYARLLPTVEDAKALASGDYRDMTLGDFRELRLIVAELWQMAQRVEEVRIDGQMVPRAEAKEALLAALEKKGIPAVIPGEKQAVTARDEARFGFLNLRAILTRVEPWARGMDGGTSGAFTRYLFREIRQRLTDYRTAKNQTVKRLRDMVAALKLDRGTIDATEFFDYTFGSGNGGVGIAELLGAMLHMGNESNLRKLLVGRGWGQMVDNGLGGKVLDTRQWDRFIARMIEKGVITKAHFEFVQSVWDLNEELKPQAQETHFEMLGYRFDAITAVPFENALGTWTGGYVPAAADRKMVPRASEQETMEDLQADFRQMMPGVDRGMTKSRVTVDRPLDLDIRRIAGHLDKVLRFIHVAPAISDALSLVRDRDFHKSMTRFDRSSVEKILMPFLTRASTQVLTTRGINGIVDGVMTFLRVSTGSAIMFANVVNAGQQVTGLSNATVEVAGRYLRGAAAELWNRRGEAHAWIRGQSKYMADRAENDVGMLTGDIDNMVIGGGFWSQLQAKWGHRTYFAQRAVQNQVDAVVWLGAYRQSIEASGGKAEGQAHRDAVEAADSAVRITQGSAAAEDVAAYEVNTPFARAWLQFGGYINGVLNQIMAAKPGRERAVVAVKAFLIPALLSAVIAKSLRGEWDDEDDNGYVDEVFEAWALESAKGALGMAPAVGGIVTSLTLRRFQGGNKPGDRMGLPPAMSAIEQVARTIMDSGPAMFGDSPMTRRQVRDVWTLAAYATKLAPLAQVGKSLGYLNDGADQATGPVDWLRGVAVGR